jgi:hypothetical protein
VYLLDRALVDFILRAYGPTPALGRGQLALAPASNDR